MTDEELLQKCIDKDRAAWNEFVRRFSSLVTRSVRYKLNRMDRHLSKNETLDIVQEIFLLIWKKNKLRGVKNTACLKSWLAIVSINLSVNYCRRNVFKTAKNTLSLDENPLAGTSGMPLGFMIPSSKLNTAKTLRSNELSGILDKEISKLGYRQQLVLKLNIYHGKKQKDIAEIMNIPTGTVATLIRRAKDKLRKNLGNALEIE